MTKYFNNHRCRVILNNDIFGATKLQILVKHSYLNGFVWFYKWHTIGETYFELKTEKELIQFIKRVFDKRNKMRRERRLKQKMQKNKIPYIT